MHVLAEVVGLSDWQDWTLPVLHVAVAYAVLGVAVIRQIAPLSDERHHDVRAAVPAAR